MNEVKNEVKVEIILTLLTWPNLGTFLKKLKKFPI